VPLLEVAVPLLEVAVPLLEVAVPLLEVAVPLLEVAVPLLELPPGHGPHTPSALPTATLQVSPGQQSALTLHLPQVGTQVPPW
jgi:hypothetical protein